MTKIPTNTKTAYTDATAKRRGNNENSIQKTIPRGYALNGNVSVEILHCPGEKALRPFWVVTRHADGRESRESCWSLREAVRFSDEAVAELTALVETPAS